MNDDQNIYVYGTEKQPEAGPIGPPILFVGALATAGLWVNELFNWIEAVAADPISRPYEALIVAGIGCLAAYYAWRTVRMAYLMTCSLCFLTYDSGCKILNYFDRTRNQQ